MESLSVLCLAEETLSLSLSLSLPTHKQQQQQQHQQHTQHPLPLCSLLIAKLSASYTGIFKSSKEIQNIVEKCHTPDTLTLAAGYLVKIKLEKGELS